MDSNIKWEKLSREEVKSEEIQRPSLTYWQDAFRRLRKNKIAMISLGFLMILIISVIVLPWVWPREYSDQVPEFHHIPPRMEIYDIGDDDFIYITDDFKVIEVSNDGDLLKSATLSRTDAINRIKYFDLDGKEIVLDYGVYIKAKEAYEDAKRKAETDSSIDLTLEKKKLDETSRFSITVDGKDLDLTNYKDVKTQKYIIGTDSLGRDFFIRVIYGGRISLAIAFAAAIINFVVGVAYGGIAGYLGGKVDNIMMRFVDIISTIPLILYVIVLMVVLEPGLNTLILALSLTYWVNMARIVRGQVLSLKEQEFVLAAKALGASFPRIILRHIIPNTMGPIMVALMMQIPAAIFTEAFLGFLGLGVPAPIPSWGSLANDGLSGLLTYPYLMFYPALIMSITLLAFNLFGDGLRDALDPRLRK